MKRTLLFDIKMKTYGYYNFWKPLFFHVEHLFTNEPSVAIFIVVFLFYIRDTDKWELSETGGECNNQKCHLNLYNQNRFQGHDSLALGQLTSRKLI